MLPVLSTFGSEALRGDQVHLHQALVDAEHGGIGKGITPMDALKLGLEVDVGALALGRLASQRDGSITAS